MVNMTEIMSLINNNPVKFDQEYHVVEFSRDCGVNMFTCDTLFFLLSQFNGGLNPSHIIYLGTDADRAQKIYDYGKAFFDKIKGDQH